MTDRRRFSEEEMQALGEVIGKAVATAVAESVAEAVEKKLTEKFYINIGKSVWSILYKALFAIALGAWYLRKEH